MRFEELLFRDSRDRVTGFEERRIDDELWIGLNGAVDTIPSEARAYKDRPLYGNTDAIIKPDGSYLDMEWGAQPDWFDLKHHWRGYIPVSDGRDISAPWFVRFQRPVKLHVSPDGQACIDLSVNMEMIYDLDAIQEMVEDIRIFGKTGVMDSFPDPFNTEKWGILLDLERDWRALDFGLLTRHDVPIFYHWTDKLAADERFARFDPKILREFHAGHLAVGNLLRAPTPAEAYTIDCHQRLITHDNFLQFQRIAYEDDPLYGDPTKWKASYFVTDFMGWHRRPIKDHAQLWLMAQQFAATTLQEDSGEVIVYHWWITRSPEPEDGIDQGGAIEGDGDNGTTAMLGDPDDIHELQELFKDPYAPSRAQQVDETTGLLMTTPTITSTSLLDRIARPEGQSALITNMSGDRGNNGSLLDRIGGPQENPEAIDNIGEQADDNDGTVRGRSPLSNRTTMRRRHDPREDAPLPNRHSLSPLRGPEARTAIASPWARRVADIRGSSSDPGSSRDPDAREDSDGNTPRSAYGVATDMFPTERSAFIDQFRGWGAPFTHATRIAAFPSSKVEWDANLLHDGWLIIDRPEVEVRMRYYAATHPGVHHIRQVLEYAIEKGLRFRLGVQLADMGKFRPLTRDMPTIECTTGRQPHQMGFQEDVLTWGQGGTAFRMNYLGKMGAVLNRAHAGAFIGRGGGLSWIAQTFGGHVIVQKFIRGPSTTISWHNSSESDSTSDQPSHAQYDFVSPGEESLILGHIPHTDSEHERWVFPPEDLLALLCDFWSGEWSPRIERVFLDIKREIDQDRIRARTRGEWRAYFRRANHSTREPEHKMHDDAVTEGNRRLLGVFGRSWSSQQLWTLRLPEAYDPLTRQKKGGFVRRC
ncbi:hypothetical protein FPV67DRAFT_1448057 [Lyophyllum atratum]|nr:hypothetical protein FPV67DRAFT_1448057 [Lyophyllum atratum]